MLFRSNFIFAQEFSPFRNQLELGKGVYLNVGGRRGKYTITPYIIEFELDFEERILSKALRRFLFCARFPQPFRNSF